ncbi:heme-binding domain-containing protein [Robertkochia aurantiaca]|uniref:heme-binding domain-containing protein n=1 Tax=Robertkochia aurantiaca TaxID=2873700 RepID=UPI001CCEE5A5|nr:heme-binding domain-containing protein [Robertkochia sp. 3YJGBD-33]
MRIVKISLWILLGVFIIIQFIRPEKNISTDITQNDLIVSTKPAPEVEAILRSSCYDCHSNNTDYPWYSNIAPVSFWLNDHIEEGKEHLNFSIWEQYDNERKAHKMEEIAEEVEEGEMPLDSYTWIHGDARLTPEQVETLVNWAKGARTSYELAAQPQ